MNNSVNLNFPITVYGNLEKFTDVMSLGRCRIFYKYDNRNGTYITDEFAEELIKTLPYTPVKGIYEEEMGDYSDHGESRNLGRIYGIVPGPQDMNFAWEKHLDDDGVEREYACVNVYYYTALYEEAGEISGKSQSMELYKKSVKGDWKIINGKRYFVFEKASFLGLQILGDDVEPCFQGAAFFSLYEGVKDLCEKLEQYQNNFQNYGEGGNTMPTVTFKVSDSQKHSFLWTLLNPNYNETGNWTVEYGICEIYEDYAIVMNYAENKYERIYYAKNDEADSLEITNREDCYIIDVSSAEKEALARLRSLNSDTYEAVDEKFEKLSEEVLTATESLQGLTTELETAKEENSQFEIKIEELGNQIATLNTEKETANSDLVAVTNRLAEVAAERDELATYKKNIVDTEKRNLINDYSDQLDQTVLDEYLNNLDGYTLKQLDMELTYQVKVCRPEIFSKNPASTVYIPKDTTPVLGALETLLSKYERK